jgi:zinc protease
MQSASTVLVGHQTSPGDVTAPSGPLSKPAISSPTFKPQRKILANGVTVIVAENRFIPTVVIQASMRAGAMREADTQAGVANLTTRMLERGTSTRNVFQLAEGFDFLGAHLSMKTDYLSATAKVQGLSKDAPAFFQLLGEMFQTPAFPPAQFESLRSEVLGELHEYEADARWLAIRGMRERIYAQGHPFRRMAEGTIHQVEKVKLADVLAFYKRHYRPDQFVLSIAGDVRAELMFELAAKTFGRWSASGTPEPFAMPAASVGLGAAEHWIELRNQTLSEIVLGVLGVSIRHPDYYPMLILNHILGQAGFGGRLGSRLGDAEGLALSTQSSFDASLVEGPFVIRATANSAGTARVIELLRAEAEKVRKLGVTTEEVTSAKKALIHGWPVQLENNEAVARQLLSMELFQLGDDYLQQYPELITSVKMEAILGSARTHFGFDQGALVVAGPAQRR